ncbi:hypothetical protein M3Y97_00635900 [Aphelenchoides bicaudatus]|nr:hypothetical protein M3Y97_00635900 [Aphelenchoides bicaudatus]
MESPLNSTAMSKGSFFETLSTVHRICEYSAEATALITNTILVYLIVTEKKQAYKDYRRVLLLNCIIDYLCTVVGILLQPHFEILGGQWIYILSEPLIYFPRTAQMLIGGCDKKLSVLDLVKLTGISFTSSTFCGFLFFSCFYISQGTEFPAQTLLDSGLIGTHEAKHLLNAEMTTWSMILLICMAAISNTVVFTLILYFSYQIYTKLNLLRKDMHPKTRKMQSQMNLMLAAQTISAFGTGVIPMLFLVFFMSTRIDIVGAGTVISIFFAFVPINRVVAMRLTIFILLLFCVYISNARLRFPKPKSIKEATYKYDTMYFPTPLDHFDPTFEQKPFFKVKYLINKEHFKKGGPLFFYTGNEGEIEAFLRNTGIMFDIAPNFNALVVFCEHRYYGDGSSLPFGLDSLKSIQNAKYLTIEQTLEDFARLVRQLKSDYGITQTIAFGGSYGGMLSAWFRQKYPHLIDGAWAASAPTDYFRNSASKLGDYDKIVSRTMQRFGCNEYAFTDAMKSLDKCSYRDLNNFFKVDPAHPIKSSGDVQALRSYIKDQLGTMAMVNYPYKANFMGNLGAWPMKTACSAFSARISNVTKASQELANAVNAFLDINDIVCFLQGCEVRIDPWEWQSCTQVPIDICSQGPPNDLFFKECDIKGNATVPTYEKFQEAYCNEMTDPAGGVSGYSVDMIQFDFIQQHFGFGLPGVSNIILTNGKLDPWSAGAPVIKEVPNPLNKIFVITMDGAGHHLDLRQPNTCDPPPVTFARYKIINILQCWLGNHAQCNGSVLEKEVPLWSGPDDDQGECKDIINGYPWGQDKLIHGTTNRPPSTTSDSSPIQSIAILLGLLTAVLMFN